MQKRVKYLKISLEVVGGKMIGTNETVPGLW